MDSRKVTLIATIAVIALVAVGVGYAYTASTTNSGNSADSNYIVLSQSAYTWGSKELYLNTETSSGPTYLFQLAKGGDDNDRDSPAGIIAGTGAAAQSSYYGVQIGSSVNFSATKVGDVSNGPYKVTITNTSNLTDPTGTYWSYIIVFQDNDEGTTDDDEFQYAYSNNGTSWTYVGKSGSTDKNDGIYLKDVSTTTYAVSIYFGGYAVEYSTGNYTAQDLNPPAGTAPSSYTSAIINSGSVKFSLEFDKPA